MDARTEIALIEGEKITSDFKSLKHYEDIWIASDCKKVDKEEYDQLCYLFLKTVGILRTLTEEIKK